MPYVLQSDFLPYIKDSRLQQMLDSDASALDDAIYTAEAVVSDALYSRYDLDAILALTDDDRPKQLVRWIVVISLYYLYERLPDKIVPDRVVKNYDETLEILTEIEDGKKSVNLPLIVMNATTNTLASKFRWGSSPQRSH
jgi:phage gp36-like protein